MSTSKIQWTEHTWNPVRGCSRVSPGCVNCYAERAASNPRFGQVSEAGEPFAIVTPSGPRWTGRVELIPHMLDIPLRRKKPTVYFVNSMSDLFHESLPDEAIDRVFAAMALCRQHVFQVLTKRAERMREYFTVPGRAQRVGRVFGEWPLPNVHLGVSVEDQQRLDRIEHLRATPAALRFLSLEPLLEDLGDITPLLANRYPECGTFVKRGERNCTMPDCDGHPSGGIDWVICGGESGPDARACNLGWLRSIRNECGAAGVPCFVKQLGKRPYLMDLAEWTWEQRPHTSVRREGGHWLLLQDAKGGAMEEWPKELQVRERPEVRR